MNRLLATLFIIALGFQVKAQTISQFGLGVEDKVLTTTVYSPTDAGLTVVPTEWLSGGQFDGITYGDNMKTLMTHLDKVRRYAILYNVNSSYRTTTHLDQIKISLKFVSDNLEDDPDGDHYCGDANWNNSALGVPELINQIFAYLKIRTTVRITDPDYSGLLEIAFRENDASMDRCEETPPIHEAGDEMIWLKVRALYYYNLDNPLEVENTLDMAKEVIENDFSSSEGLRADFTLHDHGSQLYMTEYGLGGYLANALELDKLSYYMDKRLLKPGSNCYHLITNYGWKFLGHQFFDDRFDWNAMGRHLALENGAKIGWGTGALVYRYLAEIDPARSALYNNIDDPITYPYSTDFHDHSYRSDYMIHRTENYFFSVRMSSSRVGRQERNDSPSARVNWKNRFTALGATNISLDKSQYEDLFYQGDLNLDRNKIPGTTTFNTPHLTSVEPWENNPPNGSGFCGGVSYQNNGVTAYEVDDPLSGFTIDPISGDTTMNPDEFLKAKKAWFCFGDKIVCLGTDIDWNEPGGEAWTTINQSSGVTSARVLKTTGSTETVSGLYKDYLPSDKVERVWHDRIGYMLLGDQTVRTGVKLATTRDIFKLYLKHSETQNDYAYVVHPNILEPTFFAPSFSSEVEVLRNDGSIQAVYDDVSDILQVVFYEPGELTIPSSGHVTVDKPCILMITNMTSDTKVLSICDPNQNTPCVRIDIEHDGWLESSQIDFPTGLYAGQTVHRTYNKTVSGTNSYLSPTMDAYVRDGVYSSHYYGTENKLVIKNDGPGYKREAYLKFNLKYVHTSFDGTAELRLRLRDITNTVPGTFGIYRVEDDNWTEDIITDSNKPTPELKLIATAKAINGQYLQVDISQLVKEELLKDKVLTIAIRSMEDNGVDGGYYEFHSKEFWYAPDRPRLTLSEVNDRLFTIEDAYVDSSLPEDNFESIHPTELKIKDAELLKRQIYLKFDISDASLANGNKVTLRMNASTLIGSPAQIDVYRVRNNDWSEGTITWSTRPLKNELGAFHLDSETGFLEWDITNLMATALSEGEQFLSLKLESHENNYQVLCSKDCGYADRPQILFSNYPSISPFSNTLLPEQLNTCQPPCYASVVNVWVSDQHIAPPSDYHYGYNLLDCNLGTRWSALAPEEGFQSALFELDAPTTLAGVDFAFHKGDLRTNTFGILLMDDNWNSLGTYSFTSSGSTLSMERFLFGASITGVKYISYLSPGNSLDGWVSLTEAKFPSISSCRLADENLVEPEIQNSPNLAVYPNPTSGLANITGLNTAEDWSVYDISGKVVLQGNKDVLDLSGLGQGIYFLRTSQGRTLKIVRQ